MAMIQQIFTFDLFIFGFGSFKLSLFVLVCNNASSLLCVGALCIMFVCLMAKEVEFCMIENVDKVDENESTPHT